MEKRLKALFNYQKFVRNEALNSLISDVESRYQDTSVVPLSDENLSLATAAGEPEEMQLLSSHSKDKEHDRYR